MRKESVLAPSATDEKLAERIDGVIRTLSDFRVEAAGKFASIETELGTIRKLGTWLLGGVFGLIAALITGAATVGWSASAVVSETKHQGERLEKLEGRMDRVEKRLDGIDRKLDTLIERAAPRPGG